MRRIRVVQPKLSPIARVKGGRAGLPHPVWGQELLLADPSFPEVEKPQSRPISSTRKKQVGTQRSFGSVESEHRIFHAEHGLAK